MITEKPRVLKPLSSEEREFARRMFSDWMDGRLPENARFLRCMAHNIVESDWRRLNGRSFFDHD